MSNADIYHEMIIDFSRNPINYGKIVNADIIDNKVRCIMCFAEAPSLMQLEALLNKEIEYEKIATIDLKYMDFEKWLNEDYNPPKI